MASRILTLVLACLLYATGAWAQEDYFPPAGIYIPCCYGSGTGHTGAVYGRNGSSAWRQVWGAQPGDVVTFQFVLRTASAGSLHAWPKAANWIDPEYLGDPNNPYQKWYWNTGRRESGGTFCLDCLWRFTVPPGYYNPWIWIDYWDSGDGWDVDLNVVNIQTPQLPTKRKLFTPEQKDRYTHYSNVAKLYAVMAGGVAFIPGVGPMFKGSAWAAGGLALLYEFFANDPYDGNYWTLAAPQIDPQLESDLSQFCYEVYATPGAYWQAKMCASFIISLMQAEAHLRALKVTNDRIESCIIDGAGCEDWQRSWGVQLAQASANWLYDMARWHEYLANTMELAGIDDIDPDSGVNAISILRWYVGKIDDAVTTFQGVQ